VAEYGAGRPASVSTALLACCCAAALTLGGCAAGADPAARHAAASTAQAAVPYRVVMQVSNADPRGWRQALNDSLALTKNAGRANVQIEIVAIGAGIGMLRYDSPWPKEVAASQAAGVRILACGETMKSLLLEKDELLPGIDVAPAGLIEVIDRQREGWHYVKAD
jgi:uncharacterized protein